MKLGSSDIASIMLGDKQVDKIYLGDSLIYELLVEGGWEPLELFAVSEAGGWYDPSDLSTLWLDIDGTQPVTADGDAVARIDDKSGNGNHLLQETAARRPLYKTAGGLHWLFGDGIDDFLGEPGPSHALTTPLVQPLSFCLGVKRDAFGTGSKMTIDNNGVGGRCFVYHNGTDQRMHAGALQTYGVEDLGVHVHVNEFNGASSFGRVDGVQSGPLNAGTNGLGSMRLFGDRDLTGYMQGRIYGVVVVGRQLTVDEIANVETYMAAKSGVTL